MAYTEEQIAYVRENSETMGAESIGRAIGLTKRQVRHIRDQLKLARKAPGTEAKLWTEDRKAEAYRLYIVEGLPASEVGERLGLTALNIRVIAHASGWKRDPAHAANNTSKRKRQAAPKAVSKAVAELTATRFIVGTDAELVADFLSRREVTVCEPGWACGLTKLETAVGFSANPARISLYQERVRRAESRKEKSA